MEDRGYAKASVSNYIRENVSDRSMTEIWEEIWMRKGLLRAKRMEGCSQIVEGKSFIFLLIVIHNYTNIKII